MEGMRLPDSTNRHIQIEHTCDAWHKWLTPTSANRDGRRRTSMDDRPKRRRGWSTWTASVIDLIKMSAQFKVVAVRTGTTSQREAPTLLTQTTNGLISGSVAVCSERFCASRSDKAMKPGSLSARNPSTTGLRSPEAT